MPSTGGLGQRVQATPVGARLAGHLVADEDGELMLPAGLLAQAGLDAREGLIYQAGRKVLLEVPGAGIAQPLG
jgi:hypothetical protein